MYLSRTWIISSLLFLLPIKSFADYYTIDSISQSYIDGTELTLYFDFEGVTLPYEYRDNPFQVWIEESPPEPHYGDWFSTDVFSHAELILPDDYHPGGYFTVTDIHVDDLWVYATFSPEDPNDKPSVLFSATITATLMDMYGGLIRPFSESFNERFIYTTRNLFIDSLDPYSASIEYSIPPQAVPVPAAIWLFSSSLVALAGIKRRGS